MSLIVCAAITALALFFAVPQPPSAPQNETLYEEDVAATNPQRSEQAGELEAYLKALREDRTAVHALFKPDYSSPGAYDASARKLRQALRDSLGYPPPGKPGPEPPEFHRVGEDSIAVYYRTRFSVLPGVHVVGLYLVPKNRKAPLPLVIAMHGGGGSPEVATFHGGANYHDMVRGAAREGYAVWAPQHLYVAEGYPADFRQRLDSRARSQGTTITAIEIAKITRGLDVVLKRPEVDRKRVAMIGLSYGGFYTLYTTALEPRIKVAVSSCFFSDRAALLDRTEPTGWNDWRFTNGLSLFSDSAVVSLICPRPLEVQVGAKDDLFPIADARGEAPKAASPYRLLNIPDWFRFVDFDGGHEWHGETGWDWLRKHL